MLRRILCQKVSLAQPSLLVRPSLVAATATCATSAVTRGVSSESNTRSTAAVNLRAQMRWMSFANSPRRLTNSTDSASPPSFSSSSSSAPYPFFRLPAVIDAPAFISLVRRQVRALQRYEAASHLLAKRSPSSCYGNEAKGMIIKSNASSINAPSAAVPIAIDVDDPEWTPLTHQLTIPQLEYEMWERRALKNDMLSTILIPYHAAKEIILERLPDKYRVLAEQELAFEESVLASNAAIRKRRAELQKIIASGGRGHSIILGGGNSTKLASESSSSLSPKSASGSAAVSAAMEELHSLAPLQPVPTSKIIQYKDDDVYGTASLMKVGNFQRPPVVCVMGHIDHGKTTLLDTIMASNMCGREAGKITQSVRCFTVDVKTCVSQLEAQKRRHVSQSNSPCVDVGEEVNESKGASVRSEEEGSLSGSACISPPPFLPPSASLFELVSPSRYATYPSTITFVDTPGHKVFAEMRFHSQLAADVVVLIIALDEGILGQTLEVLHVALNADRPIIVAFNKTDKYTDPRLLAGAIMSAVQTLAKEGLRVKLISSFDELDALKRASPNTTTAASTSTANNGNGKASGTSKESLLLSRAPIALYLAKRSQLAAANAYSSDATGKKKRKTGASGDSATSASVLLMNPILESGKLQRKVLGICLSGKSGANVDLLLETIRIAGQLLSPVADAGLGTKVQAQVLEASKSTEQTEQRELHSRLRKSEGGGAGTQRGGGGASGIAASSSDLQKELAAQGTNGGIIASTAADRALRGFSTNQMIITAIVRSGVLRIGMPFVADQCVGTIRKLCDYWGRPVRQAMPGTAVVIIDDKSKSGCPGVGTHVIDVGTVTKAEEVNTLRKQIAWFVEAFPKRTALMRPNGLDTSFKAVGNFGQTDQKESERSLQYRLLYGGGGGSSGSDRDSGAPRRIDYDATPAAPATPGADDGGVVSESSAPKENKAAESVGPSSVVEGTPAEVEARWSALQPEKLPATKAEMDEVQQNGKLIGVYCKVDSWHSARILQREIPRLSTKHIFFSVLGIKFGQLKSEDTQDFINNSKIVICYRTPRLQCPKTFRHLELFNFHFLETDIYSNVVTWLKMVAIEEHEKFVKERGSLEAQRNTAATASLLGAVGIGGTYGKRRGRQALTRSSEFGWGDSAVGGGGGSGEGSS